MHFVGLDWASRAHAVCILDERGGEIDSLEVTHDDAGLSKLQRRLKQLNDCRIAIERPDGVVVDSLLEAGLTVVPIHPNVVKATRSRYRVAGKSDPGDAYILADLLRTDGHRFRSLLPHTSEIKALRVLVRSRKDLVRTRVAVANQLRSLLQAHFPGAAELFAEIDSQISLAFLRQYPDQSSADRLTEKRFERFLRGNGYTGRRTPAELLRRLEGAPHAVSSAELENASRTAILALIDVLEPITSQIALLQKDVDAKMKALPDASIVQSFPGSGVVTAAMILSKLGSDRNRFQTAEQFASLAGVTPVTYASGKQRGVGFRRECDRELREALTCLADNSRKRSAWAAQAYVRARDRGCDHPHAIRIVARSWARVLWRCWQNSMPYDPAAHTQARILTNADLTQDVSLRSLRSP